ncbi:hypothetical protein XELAEV_18016096mg [Xenopus laevis]|uniref:Uncharacterized protein n=1 Tax=Xenopus laevis TaxID=8355 RepID=A0A974DKW0_XENLA|nr:hypothetical protein XELAEV_18016096mg [Xenopus laevis]
MKRKVIRKLKVLALWQLEHLNRSRMNTKRQMESEKRKGLSETENRIQERQLDRIDSGKVRSVYIYYTTGWHCFTGVAEWYLLALNHSYLVFLQE